MLRRICSLLSTIVMIFLGGLAALLLVPRIWGCETLAVLTGSMEPAYPVGSLVYIEKTDPTGIREGDVITFRMTDSMIVTHRVVAVEDGFFLTKGDANAQPDGVPVAFDSVMGRAVRAIPYLGFISIYIRTPVGIGVICLILIVIVLLTFLPEIFSDEGGDREAADAGTK